MPSESVPSPPVFQQGSTADTHLPERAGPDEVCIACNDHIGRATFLRGPCNHVYCEDCFIGLATSSLRDESLHPLRCCNQPFNRHQAVDFLPRDISSAFLSKAEELGIPADRRIYCPIPTCSAFLGSTASRLSDFACGECFVMVCPRCRQRSHPGESCPENTAAIQVRDLARAQAWQTCPTCQAVVELSHGCFHMTCRCRQQFCYICAVPWKNCTCPQWDEGRLIARAQGRVQDQFGEQNEQGPAVFRERVEEETANLRHNHGCFVHEWTYHRGRGRCEECGEKMSSYRLVRFSFLTFFCQPADIDRVAEM